MQPPPVRSLHNLLPLAGLISFLTVSVVWVLAAPDVLGDTGGNKGAGPPDSRSDRHVAQPLDPLLPCQITARHRPPLEATTHLANIRHVAHSLPKSVRTDFVLSINSAGLHVRDWWIIKALDSLQSTSAQDPLPALVGVPLATVRSISQTSYGGSPRALTHRYRLAGNHHSANVQSRLKARGFSQKAVAGKVVWWIGQDGELDHSFDRADPFHFEMGASQRFWTLHQDLFLAPEFSEVEQATSCLDGSINPSDGMMLQRTLYKALSGHLETLNAITLTNFAWDHAAYFNGVPRLADLISKQLSDNASIDMTKLHQDLVAQQDGLPSGLHLPPPIPLAPVFADATTPRTETRAAERWSLMALLFPNHETANAARPVLVERMNKLYAQVFKRQAPQIDAISHHIADSQFTAVIVRARMPLLEAAGQRTNHINLWNRALLRRQFNVLQVR